MFNELEFLIKNSYSPKSKYAVSCILKMKDGKFFKGVNVENPSFKDGMCAEQNAIAAACSHGYGKGDFSMLYVITDGESVSTPCFLCRQVIVELFDPDTTVICYNKKGEFKVFTVKALCPDPFSEKDLK